jgi:hypothetical protein
LHRARHASSRAAAVMERNGRDPSRKSPRDARLETQH